jgi:hypothetical protein
MLTLFLMGMTMQGQWRSFVDLLPIYMSAAASSFVGGILSQRLTGEDLRQTILNNLVLAAGAGTVAVFFRLQYGV